eukprot:2211034-Pleurochrysis_carterae.AAC.3
MFLEEEDKHDRRRHFFDPAQLRLNLRRCGHEQRTRAPPRGSAPALRTGSPRSLSAAAPRRGRGRSNRPSAEPYDMDAERVE